MDKGDVSPSISKHSTAKSVAEDEEQQDGSDPSTPIAGPSGAQTSLEVANKAEPTSSSQHALPVNDELERFRSEWKKEVQARGQPTHAYPAASSSAFTSSSTSRRAADPTALPWSTSSVSVPASSNDDLDTILVPSEPKHVDGDHFGQDQAESSQNGDPSIPFPEAEIYAPAALKYSKGAHKIPRPAPTQSRSDLPDPVVPAEYHPLSSTDHTDGLSSSSSSTTTSLANGVSHDLRDRIRASAAPFSSSTSPSRPLAPKQQTTTRLDQRTPSSLSGPVASGAPRIMATPSAPAHASQATQSGMRSSVEAYAHAVEMERSGQLDQALTSYRRAFKLNANADRLYRRAHLLLTDPALANTSSQQNDALLSSPAIADKIRQALDFDDHRYVAIKERQAREAEAQARGQTYDAADSKALTDVPTAAVSASPVGDKAAQAYESRPDELAKLLDRLSIEAGGERDFAAVAFSPEDEEKEMPISRLPDEILLHVLRMVIAPRGRRGAKVVKPKPTPEEQAAQDAATAALTGRRDKPTIANGSAHKSDKAGTTPSAAAANSAKSVSLTAPVSAGKDGSAATVEAALSADKAAKEKPSDNTLVTRKQPLGIGIVLGGSDWQTLEIVGRTCWKFRLLTKSPSLWREIVRETYYPPILDPALSLTTLYERHHSDWRTAFINQPRLRLNGCYIAACHYARPGMSEDAWIRVIHVVEFYRSIRFLPDGTALSLLTTDAPSETVRKLEPSLKAKGFSKGRWELFEQGLDDDQEEGRPRGPKVVVEDLRDKSMQKYAFRMVFALRSTTRGRWNKLDLLEYHSVNLSNGEVLPLPQKHSRPFHFSRVIAYGI